jgi:hypothetical protein
LPHEASKDRTHSPFVAHFVLHFVGKWRDPNKVADKAFDKVTRARPVAARPPRHSLPEALDRLALRQ